MANLNQITFLGCPVNNNKTIIGQSLTQDPTGKCVNKFF